MTTPDDTGSHDTECVGCQWLGAALSVQMDGRPTAGTRCDCIFADFPDHDRLLDMEADFAHVAREAELFAQSETKAGIIQPADLALFVAMHGHWRDPVELSLRVDGLAWLVRWAMVGSGTAAA